MTKSACTRGISNRTLHVPESSLATRRGDLHALLDLMGQIKRIRALICRAPSAAKGLVDENRSWLTLDDRGNLMCERILSTVDDPGNS